MTREKQREVKALKAEARKQAKEAAKQEGREAKAWAKMIQQAKGALVEGSEI